MPQLDGRTPTEFVTGSMPDILAYAMFNWYQPIWYHMPKAQFPYKKKVMGQWIGMADSCTDLMAYSIVTSTGLVIMRKSVWGVSKEELATDSVREQLTLLDEGIKIRIGNQIKNDKAARAAGYDQDEILDGLFNDKEDFIAELMEPELTTPEANDYTLEAYDEYLTAKVMFPHGGESARALVKTRKHDAMGRPIRKKAPGQLMLDTRMYEVEFPNGLTEAVMVNLIAENLYSQVDVEGHTFSVIKEIVDHHKDGHALSKDDGYLWMKLGQKRLKWMTRGWDLLCELGGQTTTWILLKDIKELMPVQVAEYAIANKLADEPAFVWWVRNVLC